MSDRPTPAEAMALWYSLERPSGPEVAARFTAAGRPITYRTITRWKKQNCGDSALNCLAPVRAELNALSP